MKKILAVLLSFIILLLNPICVMPAEAPAESELYAKSAVLIDADSGRVLYAKNAECEMANASTTKILTCILILENCDQDGIVTASSYAASQPKVRLGMQTGQQFKVRDLLYGLMLESFNDCAVALAEYAAGTVEGFAMLMNDKAKEIGCENSYFITPNGLDAEDETSFHHTTATDLAKIMRYCIKQSEKKEDFLTVTQTTSYSFSDETGGSNYSCTNHNAFLQMMEGALSGKTGFTGNAGYCYVGALESNGRTYIVALLACGWPNNKTYKWSDTKKLMQYGIDNFTTYSLDSASVKEEDLESILVADAKSQKIGDIVKAGLTIVSSGNLKNVLIGADEKIEITIVQKKSLEAPVEKGSIVGTITYQIGSEILREDQIVLSESIEKIDLRWCLEQILSCTSL